MAAREALEVTVDDDAAGDPRGRSAVRIWTFPYSRGLEDGNSLEPKEEHAV